jgi:ribA/ribD-fused uncharacterized protein
MKDNNSQIPDYSTHNINSLKAQFLILHTHQRILTELKMKPHQRKNPHKEPKENHPLDPDRPIFFYMPYEGIYGLFCQWHLTTFEVPISSLTWLQTAHPKASSLSACTLPSTETIKFNCAEQFMMYCKTLYFHDPSSSCQILASPDPKEQKKLGREVAEWDDFLWLSVCKRVFFEGNWWKFSGGTVIPEKQGWRDVLLGTGEREICEASSKDRRWGIGYNEKNALQYRNKWGANFLGKGLMKVREKLRERVKDIEEGKRSDWDLPEEMWDDLAEA